MSHLVAVYGTLKRGFGNHRILEYDASTFLGTTTVPGVMYSLGGFPAVVVDGADDSRVLVEVYEVKNDSTWQRLDSLEGYPGWYDKVLVKTPFGEAHMYTMTKDQVGQRRIVEDGVWK